MPAIGLHDESYDKVRLLAHAWEITEGEVVSRLLNEFQRNERRSSEQGNLDDEIAIYAVYEGVRVEGRFHRLTKAVTVTSGGHAGQTFKSPSGAAVAIVASMNPAVKPNRSGWSFWTIAESGALLGSVRRT